MALTQFLSLYCSAAASLVDVLVCELGQLVGRQQVQTCRHFNYKYLTQLLEGLLVRKLFSFNKNMDVR